MLNLGGTIRDKSAEESLAQIAPLLKNPFGITRLADITALDDIGIPTFVSYRPNGKTLSCSQGKGLSPELAKISALMESIEIWHSEECRPADLTGSYQQLRQAYPLYPITQERSLVRPKDVEHFSLEWIEGRHLVHDQTYYIPRPLALLDYRYEAPEKALFFTNSNGLASGNTREEALCHALFELIERYAISSSPNVHAQQMALDALGCDTCQNLVDTVQSKGYHLEVYRIDYSLPIPVFSAYLSHPASLRQVGVAAGWGCHLSPSIALLRAVTEAAQSRLTYISGARDDIDKQRGKVHNDYQSQVEMVIPSLPAYSLPSTMGAMLEQIKQLLVAGGYFDMFYVDLSKEELGIPVVKAFIPKMFVNSFSLLTVLRTLP